MNIFGKLFIKNYKDLDSSTVRFNYGIMCGVVGIITNLFITTFKIIIGVIISSISIIADGINNLSDALSSLITIIGFKLSKKKPSKNHPFGHERVEYITGLIISLIIIGIGLVLMQSSIIKLIEWEALIVEPDILVITVLILVLAIILKFFQSLFYLKYGRLIDSKTLKASALDSIGDSLSTFAVLISIIISFYYPNKFVDGVMGILVSLFIIYNGIKLVKETISPLIGEAPSKEFIELVSSKILSYEGVQGLHDMVIHSYGKMKTFMSAHVEVDSKVPINITHDIIDNIERDFLNELNIHLVIHMDPIDIDDSDVIYLKEEMTKIIDNIDKKLSFHDFRIVKGKTHTNLIFDLVIPNDYYYNNEQLQKRIDLEVNKINYRNRLFAKITYENDLLGGSINE